MTVGWAAQAATAYPVGTIDVCELVRHPSDYRGRRISISARLIGDVEISYLVDPECPSSRITISNADNGVGNLPVQKSPRAVTATGVLKLLPGPPGSTGPMLSLVDTKVTLSRSR